jgi:hypothetical protein
MRMRPVLITSIAALAVTSACGSSAGHAVSPASPTRTNRPASAGAPTAKADIPGFSGPVDPGTGPNAHVFGRCLHSWYTRSGSGTRVHVGYPGPANISVDLTINDQSEPPPEAHRQFRMPAGRQTRDVTFPVVPHAGFPQITVTAGQRTLICDVPKR